MKKPTKNRHVYTRTTHSPIARYLSALVHCCLSSVAFHFLRKACRSTHISQSTHVLRLGAPHFDKQKEGGVRSTLLLLRNSSNYRNAEIIAATERGACYQKYDDLPIKHKDWPGNMNIPIHICRHHFSEALHSPREASSAQQAKEKSEGLVHLSYAMLSMHAYMYACLLYYAMPCYATGLASGTMLCWAMLCHAMLCYVGGWVPTIEGWRSYACVRCKYV